MLLAILIKPKQEYRSLICLPVTEINYETKVSCASALNFVKNLYCQCLGLSCSVESRSQILKGTVKDTYAFSNTN